jgi:lycopene beta-cyclase
MPPRPDLILVGAGLANGLIALRLRQLRPSLRILLLEQGAQAGGNHTWSFHATDLDAQQRDWIAPLVSRRWQGYSVRFPQRVRHLAGGYASVLSEDFALHLQRTFGDELQCGTEVVSITPTSVTLADGQVLDAAAVIDGRGARPDAHLTLGHQAFVGHLLRTAQPHGVQQPILMDATVAQAEGYRFVYVLPFDDDVLLVEDTHYVDTTPPDPATLRANIAAYAHAQGWSVAEVLREEQGVLPITLAGDPHGFWQERAGQPCSGLRAGLFHPTTGYSLPDAVRLAERVAALPVLDAATLSAAIESHAAACWRRQAFFRGLNRMLFLAGRPQDRWRVMQRFYGLPERLIERFYAGHPTLPDRLRVLAGKPPVPVLEACRALLASHTSLQRKT